MASLEDLYQEIILDHNKHPRNFGPLPGATHRADGNNPLCGDELKVSLCLSEGLVEKIQFQGQGCAISKASASLMTEAIAGKTLEDACYLARSVIEGITACEEGLKFEEAGDLAALSGVRKFPARVKCATLAWHALLCALDGGDRVSTEQIGPAA
ncbi:SUF system NifU family Fe-S cluster assembly protein [Puniceicoccales bacterium CK1056]|uniref:SUF system NifU family Fe-S cluster assembly protein n=1 Tax=Oceanipulchritudo coccoides TaxID=2706888 RepID=A0A6B2M2Z3_9BACT|nr:SUF system NifU family Fe-S cluster assembly protein [Oceanipulchritudo coccoides]NDV62776.1 SUF system NifU family Fe-S cluster assembly protein [Oceanipulchritudo coccoides]